MFKYRFILYTYVMAVDSYLLYSHYYYYDLLSQLLFPFFTRYLVINQNIGPRSMYRVFESVGPPLLVHTETFQHPLDGLPSTFVQISMISPAGRILPSTTLVLTKYVLDCTLC